MKRFLSTLAIAAALAYGQDKQAPSVTNVELTVYLLSGSPQGTADDVPQDLGPTVKQLHGVFAYKSYKLNESFILRGRAGNAVTEGILPGNGLHYSLRYNGVRISGDTPHAVHLDGLNLQLSRPTQIIKDGKQGSESVARIYTDLDVLEGQKTVVGKSSINSGGDALILVVVAKIVN